MDARPMTPARCDMRMPAAMYELLHAHLFPGDGDEHGAVIEAGLVRTPEGYVLVARDMHLAREGVDWLPGQRGYRMMPAGYILKRVRECRDQRLVYLAVHNHGGRDAVAFSPVDLESHVRGFPALLDIVQGLPVGSLVFADQAVAGDIWLPDGRRLVLNGLTVVGRRRVRLTASPGARSGVFDPRYDRQVRMFGAEGQAVLRSAKVAIVGLGGVGILLAEYLGRLGVGTFVLVDPDRVQPSNIPRLADASDWDAMTWLVDERRPAWLRRLGFRLATRKIDLAKRIIKRANRQARITPFFSTMEERDVVEAIKGCDYVFLAADGHRARRLFNALVHQFLIPGVQLGSRIQSDGATGDLVNIHTTVRPVTPDSGCLLCNGAVSPARLQEESVSPEMRRRQKYTDEPDIAAPSVITLNALTASQAANDFLFYMTGMTSPGAFDGYLQAHPLDRKVKSVRPRRDDDCPDCGSSIASRRARGDEALVPLVD